MKVYGIDPGNRRSAIAMIDSKRVGQEAPVAKYLTNRNLITLLGSVSSGATFCEGIETGVFAIEWIQSYGPENPIGRSTIETIAWIGHFERALLEAGVSPGSIVRITRPRVKRNLLGRITGGDKELRAMLRRIWGGSPSPGPKSREPDPLAAVKGEGGHKWSALAVATVAAGFFWTSEGLICDGAQTLEEVFNDGRFKN